ncbi:aminopeptidase [Rossellomorea sp. YZS02]|uniref:aminopeptidase n=1 Tax=Rossellomorea sp. YZS02 TaxID=3097358 RepID=UPI002A0CD6B5|nr:aminopeptidase [Rossellomorea sp. YZS02]MDX8343228.1 aminopeptidase [Rossellomorea sp. YZS02]
MRDPRLEKLAEVLLTHSLKVKEGEKLMIAGEQTTKPLIKELLKKSYEIGAIPYFELGDQELNRIMATHARPEQMILRNKWNLEQYQDLDAFISIASDANDAEMSEVPPEQWQELMPHMKESNDYLIQNKKWVLLNYPNFSLAQKAKMSYDTFFDYLLEVCTVNYKQMEEAQKPLKELMDKTDKVRITGEGTDLTFSIKDIPSVMCFGERNIPDGEVYTAPVKDSVNGTITYNTPTLYRGFSFNNVSLTFEDGKIVKATADNTKELNDILDTDEGARFIGEFALGVNPKINEPMLDILFDEKINGSFHFTPGQAYEEADNGNRSNVHWDMVCIQRPEYGGGEIYFDDVLIRKDGLFVVEELKGLNPDALI